MSILSWLRFGPFYPTCFSAQPFLLPFHSHALKASFVLHNTHQSIVSLAYSSFAVCWHFSTPSTTAPMLSFPLPGGAGASGDKCPAPLLPEARRCCAGPACAQCWRLSWLAEGSTVVRCAPLQSNAPVSPQDECQQLALMTSAKFPSTFPASDVCQQAGSLFLHAASRNKEALYGYVCTRGDHYLEDFQSQTTRIFMARA